VLYSPPHAPNSYTIQIFLHDMWLRRRCCPCAATTMRAFSARHPHVTFFIGRRQLRRYGSKHGRIWWGLRWWHWQWHGAIMTCILCRDILCRNDYVLSWWIWIVMMNMHCCGLYVEYYTMFAECFDSCIVTCFGPDMASFLGDFLSV
jgi:hypothetical protein